MDLYLYPEFNQCIIRQTSVPKNEFANLHIPVKRSALRYQSMKTILNVCCERQLPIIYTAPKFAKRDRVKIWLAPKLVASFKCAQSRQFSFGAIAAYVIYFTSVFQVNRLYSLTLPSLQRTKFIFQFLILLSSFLSFQFMIYTNLCVYVRMHAGLHSDSLSYSV